MPTASFNWIIDIDILKNELIREANYPQKYGPIDYFIVVNTDPTGEVLLNGFFDLKKGNDHYTDLSSAIIKGNDTGANYKVPFVLGALYIKHNDLEKLIKIPTPGLRIELVPHIHKQIEPVNLEILYYKFTIPSLVDPNINYDVSLYPSPPAQAGY